MDRALDIVTGQTVDAEDLWLLDAVDITRYRCVSCGVGLRPTAFRLETTGKRPYFTLNRGTLHATGCRMVAYKDLVFRARRERISPEELRYFDLLPESATFEASDPVSAERQHSHSLRRIVSAYSGFPKNRDHALKIVGVDGGTYAEAIRPLTAHQIVRYPERVVRFARTDWRTRPVESSEAFEVSLKEGERCEDGSQRSYRLRIYWREWRPNSRVALMREFEALLREYVGNRFNRNHGPWLFFIGDQDADDPALFHVRDRRHICTRYTVIHTS